MEGTMCTYAEQEADEGTMKWPSKDPCPWTFEKTRLPQFWRQSSECHLTPQSGCVSLTFFIITIIIKKCSLTFQCSWETLGPLQSSAPGVFRNSRTLKNSLKQPTGSCYCICDQCKSEDR